MVLPWESEFPSPSGKRRTSVVVVLLLCSAMLQMWIGISPSAFAFMGCSIDALLLPKENSAAADAIASPLCQQLPSFLKETRCFKLKVWSPNSF